MSPKPASVEVEMNQKMAAGKDKSSDKKVQIKGKRGAKGTQAETREDLPTENRETRNEESLPLIPQERKKPSLINTIYQVFISGLCLLL